MTLSEELTWRGFVHQTTYADIAALDGEPITFYWGVDPSADSMTIGNLAAAMMVKCLIKHGHKPYLLVGGATGLIGDPDGKSEERSLKTQEEIAQNKQAIIAQYKQIFEGQHFEIVDNYDWFRGIGYLQFLREVGKHVPMRQMLARDFVQSRLGEEGVGISYAEFSYALIQGYDFLHLYKEHGVTLQVCGSDQWGNSIAGVELIRRIAGGEANVYSVPLVVNRATGKKFGKTEEGAVWLDSNKTSVYKFYQFWLNADDEGVEDYLKVFTELDASATAEVMAQFHENKSNRVAQKALAYEVTKLVHGTERADSVKRVTEALFGEGDYSALAAADFALLKEELPVVTAQRGDELVGVLTQAGLASSNSEGRRFLEQNAVYINGQQVTIDKKLSAEDCIDGRHAILRRGKNSNAIVAINE
jgi:tyrosyl-tRNA synthetase